MRTSSVLHFFFGIIGVSGFFFVQNNAFANDIMIKSKSTSTSFSSAVTQTNSLCTQNYTGVVYQYKTLIANAKTEELKKTYRNSLNTYITKWKTLCTRGIGTGTTSKTGNTVTPTLPTKPLPGVSSGYFSLDNGIFVEANTGILAKYSSVVRSQATNLTYQFKINFQYILQEMIKNGLLTTLDRATMRQKIVLYYVEDCKNLNGRTTVEQRIDSATNKVTKSNLVGIVFKINVCNDTSIYPLLRNSVPDIITHELGHVFNFIHDKNADIFSSICWVDGALKSTCGRQSFVSDYAMLNADEDYAETFTNRYRLTLPATTNTPLIAKKRYFNEIQQR